LQRKALEALDNNAKHSKVRETLKVKKAASTTDPLWYKDAIIYELHVRAFADSNNDGIGDLPGLISRLDYLQDLGVTCIWLLPFFPSPLRDDGYDIANYVDVNPSYGTLNDFKQFLDAAHQRNMQVMIELVINHTSDQHPWFKAARLASPGSAAREMYVWSDSDQLYKDARIIFTDTEKSNWTWDETAKAYYWHRFFSHQPDLNFDNPAVIEEVLKAMRFWLDMGVDALRMDAIPYLVERDGTSCENLPETHRTIKAIRAAIDAEYANRLVLAEANQWPADVRPYFGDGDECHMAFHFPLMPRIYMALRQEDRLPITDIMAQTPEIPDNCQWGLFLRNHDELTLEMVTDDERDYMYLAYSADPRMRINVGIRRRLAPLVDNNRRRIELLNSLLLSFPGTPILYYGDELGMGDNIYLGDRNGVRTPMQWSSDRNAGFSKCDPARLYFPVVMDPIYGYQVVNVEAQLSDQSSLLHWTRNMIALRKLFQVFGRGSLKFLNPANRKILAYLRDLDRGDGSHETVLCVANLSRFAQPVSLDLADHAGFEPVEMLGYVPFPPIDETPYALTLAPYSFLWLELQPAAAKPQPQSEVAPEEAFAVAEENSDTVALDLAHEGWSCLFAGNGLPVLKSSMPEWLLRQRWFGAKTRTIQSVQVQDWVVLPSNADSTMADSLSSHTIGEIASPALLYLDIAYGDDRNDLYQIPLAVSSGCDADALRAKHPLSVIATLMSLTGSVVLHDATVREDFRQRMLTLIGRNATLALSVNEDADAQANWNTVPQAQRQRRKLRESPSAGDPPPAGGRLDARASIAFTDEQRGQRLASRTGSAEQSNTSILYDQQLILKLFRRLQPGENPDVEIGRFLTEVVHFPRIATFLGEVSITTASGEKTTVAMLQGLVANQGDGWQWFLDQLGPFFVSLANIDPPHAFHTPSFLHEPQTSLEVKEYAGSALEAAAVLGRRTAEMHLALATPTSDPAFAAEPLTAERLAADARRIEAQIASTLEALKASLATLEDLIADEVALLLSRRLKLFARADAIAASAPIGQCIRIHGDYHLGQTLRTAGVSGESSDFVLLDFEGEPARSLMERRQKQCPLKDVAGMLRSFSYAAYTGLQRYLDGCKEDSRAATSDRCMIWTTHWQNAVCGQFLQAYRAAIASNPALLPAPEQSQSQLEAYLLEKALYELLYELNNRPEWLRIPLAGILAL
jgi:maltose alpha-D-glucosyltransferase/alpha-amylase